MEIELKYAADGSDVCDAVWEDSELSAMSVPGEEDRRSEIFYAVYYDTFDHSLMKNDIAFRIRKEGDTAAATLKWNGKSDGPLHIRNELNLSLGEWRDGIEPDLSIFRESEIGGDLEKIVGKKPLRPLMRMGFRRRSMRIGTETGIAEISVDEGEIVTEKGTAPISEVEIELFSGEAEDIKAVGEMLREKYDLIPGSESKFARGLKLLDLIQEENIR